MFSAARASRCPWLFGLEFPSIATFDVDAPLHFPCPTLPRLMGPQCSQLRDAPWIPGTGKKKARNFGPSTLRGSTLRGSTLRGSTLRGSTLRGSTLLGSTLLGSTLLLGNSKHTTINFKKPKQSTPKNQNLHMQLKLQRWPKSDWPKSAMTDRVRAPVHSHRRDAEDIRGEGNDVEGHQT